jgi:hypothetical protein
MRHPAILLAFLLLVALPVAAQPQRFVEGQREIGPIVVRELAVRDGRLFFRADSGGCTDAASFAVDVVKEPGTAAAVPHYRLTIRRVRADDCKALLLEGIVIELDLAKDLGLAGRFTVSVENPVLVDGRASP